MQEMSMPPQPRHKLLVLECNLIQANIDNLSIRIPLYIHNQEWDVETKALINSNAAGTFISSQFAIKHCPPNHPLVSPITINNVDKTPNKQEVITYCVYLSVTINQHTYSVRFLLTNLGQKNVILEYSWLKQFNPNINWQTGSFKWKQPAMIGLVTSEEENSFI